MALDILTFGEALVEIMRTEVGQPLNKPGLFTGPYPSGAPFIFAMQAARLGAYVAAYGSVGQDAFGQCLLNQMQIDQIDTRGIHRLSSHATGVAFVAYNEDHSRDFVFHIKQAAAGQIHADMLLPDHFVGLKALHIMGSTLSIHDEALQMGLRAMQMAQEAGAIVSFDPNLRPQLMPNEHAKERFKAFIESADLVMPTSDELIWLTGARTPAEAIDSLLDMRPGRILVATNGAKGCTVYTSEDRQGIQAPGFSVTEVDPTGAGDCFDAGFLVRWLATGDTAEAARFANACGALAVTKAGPAEGAHHLADVEAFIASKESAS